MAQSPHVHHAVSMAQNQITPDMTVNELLAARPEATGVLLDLGIDTCCGGSLSLAEAASDAGLSVDQVVGAVDSEGALEGEAARE